MENKDLERAIYMWFNMKYELYSRLDHDDSIYLYYEGEEYADIRIDRMTKYIYYEPNFRSEFFEVFPLELDDFKRYIVKWVGDTFNLMEFTPEYARYIIYDLLKIPK